MTVILGGGISGLSAAYYAAKNAKITSVSLLEASNRVGGWIRSRVSPNGAIFEQGPRSIRVPGAGKNTLDLVEDLQLTDKLIGIQYNHLASKNRLIYSNGTLHLLPLEISLKLLFRKIPLLNHSLTKYIWTDLNTPGVSKEDESLHSFFQRRFGQDVADKLISPIVCGVYAGDAREISIKSLFKSLFEIEQKYGSVIKGMVQHRLEMVSGSKGDSTSTQNTSQDESVGSHGALVARLQKEHCALWSLQGGLEQLPQALANHLKEQGVKIETEKKCEKLTFKSDRVELLINGATQGCSHVISSLRAKDLAELVQEQHPILSAELKAIPTVTVAVVNLEFQGDVLPLPAFGFLVPPMENLPLLGVTFDSCIIRQTSSTVYIHHKVALLLFRIFVS